MAGALAIGAATVRMGLRGGKRTGVTPAARSVSRNSHVYKGSRSQIRYRSSDRKPIATSVRFRAICVIQTPLGAALIPATSIFSVARAITKNTK